MAKIGPGEEEGSSSEKAAIVTGLEFKGLDIPEEDSQALHSQPASKPVLHAVTKSEGTVFKTEGKVDGSTQTLSDDLENESIADDASTLQAKTEGLGLTTENQKEKVADMEQKCATEISKKDEPVDIGHDPSLMASTPETALSQEGTMQPQVCSSEKSGDIAAEIEKEQNHKQTIVHLRVEVEWLKAINSQLRFEVAELSRGFGDAKIKLDSLKKILKGKDAVQECKPSVIVAHSLKDQTAPKDVESSTVNSKLSNINKDMVARIKHLAAKIDRQKQEIDSLSKNNDKLLKQYEAENAMNDAIENMLNDYKEKTLEIQNNLSKANCDKYKALKLMEEQQSMMKGEAESITAYLMHELQSLETVINDHCKLIQCHLSNCTKEIQREKQKALPLICENKRLEDQNDMLIINSLSRYVTCAVLDETNRTMKERKEEDAKLLERHSNIQEDLKKLKDKVEAGEKELADRNEEKEEVARQLLQSITFYKTRFSQLYEKYHGGESHST